MIMDLGEFRKLTAHLPDLIDLMLVKTDDEYHFGMVQSVKVKGVKFTSEDIPKKERPTIKCIVLSDEI